MSDVVNPKYAVLAEKIGLFRGLSPSDVQKIFSKGMTVRVQKGETIFLKGTTGNKMYVVLGGNVGVFDGPKCIAKLGVGETFGEMSLLNDEPRTATIVALAPVNLFVLSEDVFLKLLTKKVAVRILMNIARSMSTKVKNTNLLVREMEGR
ncbi:MAG: cyclic nucleotide-binding domain-containing protein [Candidatus Hydrogenedentes bacterium]|nr:cyclic nucleotide-binding domain-containing protein [Candidatus Hydrogenedentota bacterium]